MKMDGRRESSNVDDRRGSSGRIGFGGKGGGLGIIGVIVVGVIVWLMGGNPMSVLQNVDMSQVAPTEVSNGQNGEYVESAQEQELSKFARQVLAGTEDVWTQEFRKIGRRYEPPTLVLFSGSVQSGCGGATSSSGPFYCSADQCVYIDLDFFMSMRKQLGADGDFAYAYVIAHEVGHHVQYLLGTLDDAHAKMSRLSESEANKISVKLELQADCYAGIWAYHDNKMFDSLEDGDIEEAIRCAQVIGDDYLQKKAQGYTVPESFNHGTSAQRSKWLKRGLTSGNMKDADTFAVSYSQL
ncbi:MAG: neutral zinc metallopeptidase [Prevotellaceae bacterium]|nr:neutral zinc metallopeptidase [Candidatus Minthosoma caballi]